MINFHNVEVRFGDFVAIRNLSLEVKRGEFFTFLGPSGCGKTTTLRSLVGFITPVNGTIVVDGENITHKPIEKRDIGMIFQSYALFPTMTVKENIAFGLKERKHKKEYIENRISELMNVVDLKEDQLDKNVSQLSGGQQQRVAIARALALEPKILVLDEPLSNLDAKLRKQLRRELKRLQLDSGMTMIYVTHDQEEALTLSDRIAVFNNGEIEQVGTPREIYTNSATEFVCNFIGDANHLDQDVLSVIKQQTGANIDINLPAYIRPEKVKVRAKTNEVNYARIPAEVLGAEYYGTFSQYTYKVGGTLIKTIEKEEGDIACNVGDKVDLFIDPSNILQYKGTQTA